MQIAITGANRGIGLELTRQVLLRGETVHAGVRRAGAAGEMIAAAAGAVGTLRVVECDVTLDSKVDAFAAALPDRIDLLINNAGIRTDGDALEQLDLGDAARVYEVNALGPLRVTRRLLQADAARVVNITSAPASLHDNATGGAYGYRMSRAALNRATRTLARELARHSVLAVARSSGWVRTDMGGERAPLDVDESAAGLHCVIDGLTLEHAGGYFDHRGAPIAWSRAARDRAHVSYGFYTLARARAAPYNCTACRAPGR